MLIGPPSTRRNAYRKRLQFIRMPIGMPSTELLKDTGAYRDFLIQGGMHVWDA